MSQRTLHGTRLKKFEFLDFAPVCNQKQDVELFMRDAKKDA